MTPPAFRVEPATTADAAQVIELIGRVFVEYGFIFDRGMEVPDLLEFASHYLPPKGAFFVIRIGEAVVGSVGIERLEGATAEIHRLYVDRSFRGQGMGRALVEAVLAWCRNESLKRLVLWSDTRFERAHVLYERMGFRKTGERALDDINTTREFGYELSL